MSDRIRTLLEDLAAVARARGLSQGELARRAGMTPVGLSKAKRRGDITASLLASLARELDLELALVPRRTLDKAAEAIKAGNFFARGD